MDINDALFIEIFCEEAFDTTLIEYNLKKPVNVIVGFLNFETLKLYCQLQIK